MGRGGNGNTGTGAMRRRGSRAPSALLSGEGLREKLKGRDEDLLDRFNDVVRHLSEDDVLQLAYIIQDDLETSDRELLARRALEIIQKNKIWNDLNEVERNTLESSPGDAIAFQALLWAKETVSGEWEKQADEEIAYYRQDLASGRRDCYRAEEHPAFGTPYSHYFNKLMAKAWSEAHPAASKQELEQLRDRPLKRLASIDANPGNPDITLLDPAAADLFMYGNAGSRFPDNNSIFVIYPYENFESVLQHELLHSAQYRSGSSEEDMAIEYGDPRRIVNEGMTEVLTEQLTGQASASGYQSEIYVAKKLLEMTGTSAEEAGLLGETRIGPYFSQKLFPGDNTEKAIRKYEALVTQLFAEASSLPKDGVNG